MPLVELVAGPGDLAEDSQVGWILKAVKRPLTGAFVGALARFITNDQGSRSALSFTD